MNWNIKRIWLIIIRTVSSVAKRSHDPHLEFPSAFGGGFCHAAINSPEQVTRLVWSLNLLTSSSPPTPTFHPPCFLNKVQQCQQNPVIAGEMCRLMTLGGENDVNNDSAMSVPHSTIPQLILYNSTNPHIDTTT